MIEGIHSLLEDDEQFLDVEMLFDHRPFPTSADSASVGPRLNQEAVSTVANINHPSTKRRRTISVKRLMSAVHTLYCFAGLPSAECG